MVKPKVVLTTGAFDILHLGHMKMLNEAKKLGGRRSKLVVLIASDKTVRQNKGRRPVFSASERRKMIQNLKPVDEAIVGYDPLSFEKVLRKVKPDIVAFGYDQSKIKNEFLKYCRQKGLKVKVATLRRYRVNPMSSSDVIRRILARRLH
ncbi:MAG: adenylyltransferase/cytidyltransferase family protein [Candidatus Caldarchaeum sp.]|nr:adenylyltransferase/cytidyltransferase family protein [Candidatus Caldarchaeum sp.]